MGILSNIFGTATPAETTTTTTPAGVPAQQGNIPAAPTVEVDPNDPTAPVAAPAPVESTAEKTDDPLAEFSKLWENEPIKEGEEASQPVVLTAENLQKVMAKADFSSSINPEHLTAIAAGGEEASKALPLLLNSVIQQAMVQSTLINNKLTEKAVAAATEKAEAKLPGMLREQAVTDHAKTTNPLFSHPAVKPVMEATQAQLLQKFPNATAAEITEMTQKFIITIGESIAPKKADVTDVNAGTDFSTFI